MPDDCNGTASGYRWVNDAADREATEALIVRKINAKPYVAESKAADRWTQGVLSMAICNSQEWD